MIRRAMERRVEPLGHALATLQTRWGHAVVRLGNGRGTGSLAAPATWTRPSTAPWPWHPVRAPSWRHRRRPRTARRMSSPPAFRPWTPSSGRAGLPREASAVVRGGPSSGKTTLALRCAAEAQAAGAIVAWLDLARAFDPVEAVGRGVDLRWLLVVRPADVTEGLSLAGRCSRAAAVDLLVVDLPSRQARVDGQLRRLAAHARRVGARLIVLEPAVARWRTGPRALAEASRPAPGAGAAGLAAARAGRGRPAHARSTVAKNRYGPPGRSVDLEIHYLADGERAVATQRLASDGAVGLSPASLAPLPGHAGEAGPGWQHPRPRLVLA